MLLLSNGFGRISVMPVIIVVRKKLVLWLMVIRRRRIDFEESFAPVARLVTVFGFTSISLRGIFISQSQYAIELLKKHGLDECVSMSTPMATKRLYVDLQGTPTDQMTYRCMIGGLMYLTSSRPDITFATFVCARYQARPTVKHLKEVKLIFRYLRQSYNMDLWYPKDSGFELISYSDADHAGCKDDCKSTSGGLQFLGGKLVSWSSKKQDYTTMSTTEAEYVSLSACYAQVIWMQHVEKGTVEIYFVGTEYQLADLFTKALPKEHFEYLVHRIVIIMAQQQHATDVHPDELCPPNKRYDHQEETRTSLTETQSRNKQKDKRKGSTVLRALAVGARSDKEVEVEIVYGKGGKIL
ncbi:hypothetical protein Tco_1056895 [Tanacetum coccineum]|uniref:Reverse transcriptase Ty1/copia-type domain-containing protein n=1 Tax=Tanacetum coccineum TaxID=301880 RepID=A0ABQ5H601_9ASTR